MSKPGLLTLTIKDKSALYLAYMPFIKNGGLFIDFSIAANIVAANLAAFTHNGLLSRSEMRRVGQQFTRELRIATPSIDREVRALSGGNQQKVLLGKWLARRPRILIVDEPTRGVDVGSKAEIYRILRDLAANGIALLVVSSDLPEVLALAHRIVVMSEGRVAGEFPHDWSWLRLVTALLAGRRKIAALPGATPVFVPPWNVVHPELECALRDAGFIGWSAAGGGNSASRSPSLS